MLRESAIDALTLDGQPRDLQLGERSRDLADSESTRTDELVRPGGQPLVVPLHRAVLGALTILTVAILERRIRAALKRRSS